MLQVNIDRNNLEILTFLKTIRKQLSSKDKNELLFGKISKSKSNYHYFSITHPKLKEKKLKYILILHPKTLNLTLYLSGQNKVIRHKYWEQLKRNSFTQYNLVKSIDDNLFITHTILSEQLDLLNENLIQLENVINSFIKVTMLELLKQHS